MVDYSNFYLRKSLMIYQADTKTDYFVELHDITRDGTILDGKPLTWRNLKGLITLFQQKNQPNKTGLFPDNLLTHDIHKTIWYYPPKFRYLYFSKELNIPDGPAWCPGLIFMANGSTLSVFAFAGKDRPAVNTELYHAPFHNKHENGGMCMGSAKRTKGKTTDQIIRGWESAFFNSKFSHLIDNPCKGRKNLNTIWAKLITKGGRFPIKTMLKKYMITKKKAKTLGDLL